MSVTKESLIAFEDWVVDKFNNGHLRSPVHLSGGNEEQLIEIFKDIKKDDWVFSTYRSHYHALLKGISEDWLKEWILDNKSIHVMNKEHKFWTSAIVGGTLPVALGVALAIKKKHDKSRGEFKKQDVDKKWDHTMLNELVQSNQSHVWVFVGDMTGRTGVFWECLNYAYNHELPITFIIEDNGLSTDTETEDVWGSSNFRFYDELIFHYPSMIRYYKYKRVWPHYGTGKFVSSIWKDIIKENDVQAKGF